MSWRPAEGPAVSPGVPSTIGEALETMSTPSPRMPTDRLARFSFLLGVSFVVFMAALVLLAWLGFVCGWPLDPRTALVAGFVALAFAWWGATHYFPGAVLRTCAALFLSAIAILAASLALEWTSYDLSSDGQTYHTAGLIELYRGWNPLRDDPLPVTVDLPESVNVYPKAPWIAATALYGLTGRLEAAKTFNLLMLVAAFLVALATLRTTTSCGRAVAVAALWALNPVAVTQASSLYVDGQLASLLSILICLGLLAFHAIDPVLLVSFAATVLLTTNVKLSAIAYVLVLGVAPVVSCLIGGRPRRRALSGLFAASYAVGVLAVGFNPYVTNTLRHGSPIYPTNDWTTFLVATRNTPDNLVGKSSAHKLVLSLFARSQVSAGVAEVKLPLTFEARELAAFESGETRIGGFGPLFSAVVLAAAAVLVMVIGVSGARGRWPWDWLAAIGAVGTSVLVNPEAWWARYVPQLWLLPILIAVVGSQSMAAWIRRASHATLVLIAANCAVVTAVHVQAQHERSARLRGQLAAIAASPQPVTVHFSNFVATRLRLDHLGVRYTAVETLSCPEFVTLVGSE